MTRCQVTVFADLRNTASTENVSCMEIFHFPTDTNQVCHRRDIESGNSEQIERVVNSKVGATIEQFGTRPESPRGADSNHAGINAVCISTSESPTNKHLDDEISSALRISSAAAGSGLHGISSR